MKLLYVILLSMVGIDFCFGQVEQAKLLIDSVPYGELTKDNLITKKGVFSKRKKHYLVKQEGDDFCLLDDGTHQGWVMKLATDLVDENDGGKVYKKLRVRMRSISDKLYSSKQPTATHQSMIEVFDEIKRSLQSKLVTNYSNGTKSTIGEVLSRPGISNFIASQIVELDKSVLASEWTDGFPYSPFGLSKKSLTDEFQNRNSTDPNSYWNKIRKLGLHPEFAWRKSRSDETWWAIWFAFNYRGKELLSSSEHNRLTNEFANEVNFQVYGIDQFTIEKIVIEAEIYQPRDKRDTVDLAIKCLESIQAPKLVIESFRNERAISKGAWSTYLRVDKSRREIGCVLEFGSPSIHSQGAKKK